MTGKKTLSNASSLVKDFSLLHKISIPKYLLRKDAQKTKEEFDPNLYFTVLIHLSIINGYTLDYIYYYSENDGNPILYFRKINDQPFKTYSDFRANGSKQNLLEFLVIDGSIESFFELAVFNILAGKFYLCGHANYLHSQIITLSFELEQIISRDNSIFNFYRKFSKNQIDSFRLMIIEPYIELKNNKAIVNYCIFNEWNGLSRISSCFKLEFPHILIESKVINNVKYDCGECY